MKTLDRILLMAVFAGFVVLTIHHGSRILSASSLGPYDKLKWGVLLQTDRPFYAGGDTMKAMIGLFNFSAENAYGWSGTGDANGCAYRLTIENDQEQTVWEPYDVICGAQIVFRDLPSGARIPRAIFVPLVYYNNNGVGTQGDPLPPGFYKVHVSFDFNGPGHVPGDTPLGQDFAATVPIQIE